MVRGSIGSRLVHYRETMADDLVSRVWRPILRITRRKRMRLFAQWTDLTPVTTVLDVGGTPVCGNSFQSCLT
jgi:hypothetical protein